MASGLIALAVLWPVASPAAWWAGSARAWGDDDSTPAAGAEKPARRPAPKISRADLAAAYLRLEREYFAHPPSGEKRIEVNKGFDQATLAFFAGNFGQAIRTVDALTDSLREGGATPAEKAAVSVKVVIEPPVWIAGRATEALAQLTSLYEAPLAEPTDVAMRLRVVDPQGATVTEQPLTLALGPGRSIDQKISLGFKNDQLRAGVYRIELVPDSGRAQIAARVNVVQGQSLDEQRALNEQKLALIAPANPALVQALASCRARNKLLTDRPSDTNSAQFMADLPKLSAEVAAETEVIAAGKDPYRRRAGDYWRVWSVSGDDVPLRIYAPPASTSDKPVPLLIVLHGAGADENMFFDGYGVGIIKKIADEKGLLVASPSTYKIAGKPESLDALVEAVAHDYAIDRERIYLLGHSLGASAVSGLARKRPEAIAAACCIAGGQFSSKDKTPPMLAVAAELDGLVAAGPLQASIEKAVSAGAPVELRLARGFGHTLVVGEALPESVNWLLDHHRASPPAKPAE